MTTYTSSGTIDTRLLHDLLLEVRAIREALGVQASQSSVEIATSTRGTDIKVKAYVGSNVQEAGDAAAIEYLRVRTAMEQALVDNFAQEAARRQR